MIVAYLKLAGQQQGDIRGDVGAVNAEGLIGIVSMHNTIDRPFTAAGNASGRTRFDQMTFVKRLDQTSPKLHRMLVENENISQFELQFWAFASAATAMGSHLYSISLAGAHVASISTNFASQIDPAQPADPVNETIRIAYNQIQWVWVDGGIMASASLPADTAWEATR